MKFTYQTLCSKRLIGLGLRFGHLGKLIVSTFYKKSYYFSMLHDMDKVLIKKVAETKINAHKCLYLWLCYCSDIVKIGFLKFLNLNSFYHSPVTYHGDFFYLKTICYFLDLIEKGLCIIGISFKYLN